MNFSFKNIKEIFAATVSKGFLHLLFSNAFIYFLGFLVQLYVAWILLPEDIGRVRFLQVFLLAASLFASLGFNTAVQKFCSESRPDGEKVFIYTKTLKFIWIPVIAAYLIIVLLSFFNLLSNDVIINDLMPIFIVALIPQTFITVFMSYLEARKLVKKLSKLQAITKIIAIFSTIIFTGLFLFKGYIYGFVIGLIFTAIPFYIKIKQYNFQTEPIKSGIPFSQQWNFAKYSLFINILNVINLNTDIFIINYLIDDREVIGYYSFAATLLVSLYLVTTTISQITIPYFSERANNFIEWKRIFSKYNKLLYYFSFGVAALSIIVGPFLIKFIFQGKYDASIPFFILLVIAWFIRNLYTLQIGAIFGTGKIKYNFFAYLITTPISLVITYIFIKIFLTPGAAYANIATGVLNLIVFSIFYKLLKNNIEKRNLGLADAK